MRKRKIPRLTVIITAFKEEKTIGRAVKAIEKQLRKRDRILVVAPDKETLKAARKAFSRVEILQDRGEGKAKALNLAVKKAKGRLLVLTDGDVWIGSKALRALEIKFTDPRVGIVSGRPKPVNKKNTLFGFWAWLLTEAAHRWRQQRVREGKNIDCSGYLLTIRKKLFPHLPTHLLAEDAFLSRWVVKRGYRSEYAPAALVYVKFPENFSDWIKQKVRSVGGAGEGRGSRNFWQEIKDAKILFSLCRSPKEYFYLFLLFLARLYLWLLIFWRLKVKKLPFEKVWVRVESTK